MAADRTLGLAALALLAGCGDTMSPLRKLGTPGLDPYVVFVAQARDGAAELYVARPDGRDIRPVTYSPTWESRPAMAPDGDAVAYLRGRDTLATTTQAVWLTNLLNGAERRLGVPDGAPVVRLAWQDRATLVARTADGAVHAWAMPPKEDAVPVRLDGAAAAKAAAAFTVMLGDPPFAKLVPCPTDPAQSCAQALGDTTIAPQPLADFPVRDAARWRGDSVAYLIGDSLRVRPLGRGRERRVEWAPATPRDPRQFTLYPGTRQQGPARR